MMDHDLTDFGNSTPATGGAEGGGYQQQTCGICGNEYPRVRDHCPNCGHGASNVSKQDDREQSARPDSRYHTDISVSNPASRGIGFLIDAPTDDLAVSFASVAIDRLKTVNQVSDKKYGVETPDVTLLGDSDTTMIKPWGDLVSVPDAIPIDGEEAHSALDDLIRETDWKTREPTPHLYTEFGEPLVDKAELDAYIESHDPAWLVPAIATEPTPSDRDQVLTMVQECGYCGEQTVQEYAGRDGIPSGFSIDVDLATPVWECQTCGNYRNGGPLSPQGSGEQPDHFEKPPSF